MSYYNDYIIAVDENGLPYIAHAYATDNKGTNSAQGRRNAFSAAKGRAVKYIDKVITKSGKIRYIYPEMVKKVKQAGRFIDNHDAGLTEKIQSKYYSNKSKRAKKSGDTAKQHLYGAKAVRYKNQSRDEFNRSKEALNKYGKTALSSIKNTSKNATTKINNALGADERERLRNAMSTSAKSYGGVRNKYNEVDQLRRDYDRTFYGRIDNLKKKKKR